MKRLMAGLVIACLAVPGNCFAQTKPLEMKWGELAPMVTGHHLSLTLSDGTTVRGEAIAVRDEALLMDVSKAVKGYSKGSGAIPRSAITLIDLQRTKGNWGRIMGTVIGVSVGIASGAAIIAASIFRISGSGAAAILVGTVTAGSLGGYFAGRAIDARVVHILIVP